MLCRASVIQQLARDVPGRCNQWKRFRAHLLGHLRQLLIDPVLQTRLKESSVYPVGTLVPLPIAPLVPGKNAYIVTGIDGSHIAPDHHAGFYDCVINIGRCTIQYGSAESTIGYCTTPTIHRGEKLNTDEMVNHLRTRAEFAAVEASWKEQCTVVSNMSDERPSQLVLLDGLLTPHASLCNEYYKIYEAWSVEHIPVVGYVSAPRSTVLDELARTVCNADCDVFDGMQVFDKDAIPFLVPSGCYIGPWYGKDSFFLFLTYGVEAIRLEFPCYLAQHPAQWKLLLSILFDQINKGHGYPISLAEAHLQAVITEQDRQFVMAYSAMLHIEARDGHEDAVAPASVLYGMRHFVSAKLMRKRAIPM